MENTEDLTRQNQVLSFYCKEQGLKAVRNIIEYGKADILKLRNFRQMARYDVEWYHKITVAKPAKNGIIEREMKQTKYDISRFAIPFYTHKKPL